MDQRFASPPKLTFWSPNSWCDDVRRWGPLGGDYGCMRSWGWGAYDGISALTRKGRDTKMLPASLSLSLSLSPLPPCEDTVRRWPSAPRKPALTRKQIYQHLNLGLPASWTVWNKCLLFKPPSLWYFLTAAWADIDNWWGIFIQLGITTRTTENKNWTKADLFFSPKEIFTAGWWLALVQHFRALQAFPSRPRGSDFCSSHHSCTLTGAKEKSDGATTFPGIPHDIRLPLIDQMYHKITSNCKGKQEV